MSQQIESSRNTESGREIELLSPGGDIEAIKAAIVAGANAIYCGLDIFNARNRATNLSFDELNGVLRLAHEHHCKIFLTIKIVLNFKPKLIPYRTILTHAENDTTNYKEIWHILP